MAAIASLNVNAVFKKAAPAKKAPAKKAPAKKGPAKKGAAKKAPVRSAGTKRQGNIGPNRTLWNGWESNPEPPAYLDGSLPGDAGFDPFGLSKPVEYLQFDLDSLDGSAAVNPIGNVIGKLKKVDNAPTERTIVVRTTRVSARRGRARCRFPRHPTRLETGARTARRESTDAALARRTPREALLRSIGSDRVRSRTRARRRRDRARRRLAGFRRDRKRRASVSSRLAGFRVTRVSGARPSGHASTVAMTRR